MAPKVYTADELRLMIAQAERFEKWSEVTELQTKLNNLLGDGVAL